jgi:hypothetical protein
MCRSAGAHDENATPTFVCQHQLQATLHYTAHCSLLHYPCEGASQGNYLPTDHINIYPQRFKKFRISNSDTDEITTANMDLAATQNGQMLPPSRRPYKRVTPQIWEQKKDQIRELYIVQDKTLKDVVRILKDRDGFDVG